MGWSSWYAFGHEVTQAKMEAAFDRLVDRSINPKDTRSLWDYGYKFANLDDCWQACEAGVAGSFHDATGKPLINTQRFPDFRAMTSKAARSGLKPGFYYNNYVCDEPMPEGGIGGPTYMLNMRGSVDFLMEHGFKYVKVDSGSVYNDMQLWHDLIEEVGGGDEITIENCHQGMQEPTESWCPYDLFRTSGDAQVVGFDVEVITTAAVLNKSRPGCWAYPDTLSILGSVEETRSQFGVYALMSAPLILSFDITQDQNLLPYWDIFTNTEAIEVDQTWAGSPGKLIKQWRPPSQSSLHYAAAEACRSDAPEQGAWHYDEASLQLQLKWPVTTTEKAKTKFQNHGGGEGDKDEDHDEEEEEEKEEKMLCLTANGGDRQGALTLEACKDGEEIVGQQWLLVEGRLWHVDKFKDVGKASERVSVAPGTLALTTCSDRALRPGQFWNMSVPPGRSEQTVVKNDLSFQDGSCWGITNCDTSDRAEVTVDFGCKDLPKAPWTDKCLANEAWSFNSNGTITSVMDGQCLSFQNDDQTRRVYVAACGEDKQEQQWIVKQSGQIVLKNRPDMCIDSGIVSPPPGTDGYCATLHSMPAGVDVPELPVEMASRLACDPSRRPSDDGTQYVRLEEGRLKVKDRCVVGRLGYPSPFGPLQLWAKPLPHKKVAVLVMNRDSTELQVEFNLTEVPYLDAGAKQVHVRDVWSHSDLPPLSSTGSVQVSLAAKDSIFFVLSPDSEVLSASFTVSSRTSYIVNMLESGVWETSFLSVVVVTTIFTRCHCLGGSRSRGSRAMQMQKRPEEDNDDNAAGNDNI
mmetsp:Transcript_11909/g.26290  ORF Transcript_11909/g.26290 Transcript_11909/m.26290 type:complete len:801 (+) Transcript_11909:884-3286(+)